MVFSEAIQKAREKIELKKAWEDYEKLLKFSCGDSIIKWDEGEHPRDEDGTFTDSGTSSSDSGSSKGSKGKPKTKYAPSPQRQHKGIQVSPKKYVQLTSIMNTRYPGLKPEDGRKTINDANHSYCVTADGYGGMVIHSRVKIK